MFLEKTPFVTPKPISHSPKISPSSIPNPSPSVSTTKQMEPGYPNYGGYLYSIPGYSAFQPISYPGVMQPNKSPLTPSETSGSDFKPFPSIANMETTTEDKNNTEKIDAAPTATDTPKQQTDFEDHFTPEIIPAVSAPANEVSKIHVTESKMSITSLSQGSGATVTIPSQVQKDPKKKATERFSLKTSIPISKIDIKCVNSTTDTIFQNNFNKKPTVPFNPAFPNQKNEARVEIQSNVVIKTANKDAEIKTDVKPVTTLSNNINTLINAAEALNKNENAFRKNESEGSNEVKDPPVFTSQSPVFTNNTIRPLYSPLNIDTNKVTFSGKPPDGPSYGEQKNQILFIQNKNNSNPKMLLTIQQPNPQVLLQRTNFDSKNLQAPSRLSNQSKKCKEELTNENGTSSKVVALKRLHQENCDENDFENLITENQIYGNKIVVKEKSQGTLQEQDLKNKKIEKPTQPETKNVVLQPNFLYLSNVQFPANLMMIKNNAKISQSADSKAIKITPNENKVLNEVTTLNNNEQSNKKNNNTQNVTVTKDIHVLKSSNNVLQTLSNKNSKGDLVFQTANQKVIMNSQIVYQVPMIVDTDNKLNQPFINREYPKFIGTNKKEFPKQFDQTKTNDKLFIACPYQVDAKLQPKIVITNIRPKIAKVEEISSLDIYEKRKRLRRLKYLTNRDTKDSPKTEPKKLQEKEELRNIITPDKMKAEIYKEFTNSKVPLEEGSGDSDSDYGGEEDLKEYNTIIKEFTVPAESESGKIEFLSQFKLASRDAYKEKELDRQERMLRRDAVASAYISAGRLDRLSNDANRTETKLKDSPAVTSESPTIATENENEATLQKKQTFLCQLKLTQVSQQYKEGYERTWQEIIKERKRRDGGKDIEKCKRPKTQSENLELDPNGQLQLLTEIKKCVNENNNLIKKRLDSFCELNDGESIKILAEKNFSELNRLSKMADRSVKMFSGQDTRKRDLNPGFDSENIQKPTLKLDPPFQNYPKLNIPDISKIITLKSAQECRNVTSTQATSMDEPQNSAAGVKEMFNEISTTVDKVKDFECQTDLVPWPCIETILKNYKDFEAARKKEIADLQRRNTALRVECAHVTRAASRESDRARALLAERQNLAVEENNLRFSIQRICSIIEMVRNY